MISLSLPSAEAAQLTSITPEDSDDFEFKRGPSKVVFSLIDEDSVHFTRWCPERKRDLPVGLSIYELHYTDGDADLELYQGMLDVAVYSLLEPNEVHVGWWVLEDFTSHYTRGDGWVTDDDVEYDAGPLRPARWSDLEEVGFTKAPWWVRALRFIGCDPVVPVDFE